MENSHQHTGAEDIKGVLRGSGLKITPQRIAIYKEVLDRRDHPTADKVHEAISPLYPSVSLGTVYKTLDTLVNVGLLSRVATDEVLLRYDANPVQHHHLYLSDSGEIVDFYDDELAVLIRNHLEARSIKNFEIQDIRLQVTGKRIGPDAGTDD
ncbi:MAG: transcriptional repressor [Cyclobacteriaceae bacterium]